MKRIALLLCMLLLAAAVFAAPLKNQPVVITQPDGTEINVLASGDEVHNWLHDSNNYTIIQNGETGWYTWAVRSGESISPSQYIVGQSDPAALGLEAGVNLSHSEIVNMYQRYEASHPQPQHERVPHFGYINNLVIFIKFSDSPDFVQGIPYYDNLFNNNTQDYNSMRNYFLAVSYNQLDITTHYFPIPNGDTIVCYVDSLPRAYYMPWSPSNPMGYDENDENERTIREFTLLTNASNFVASQVPVTLDLDGDDDGNIDNICFTVQGGTTAWATLLWPHRWALYNSMVYINGARVFDFNFQLESFLNSSGASVLCHEMFHTLGAPDLYRYYDDTIDPIGSWDIMCANTNPPQSMSAWMKHKYADWVADVPTLTESGTYTINSVWSPTNNIYRIPAWRTNEYYLIEYRRPHGIYDCNIPGTGLLIYRLNTSLDGNADGPPDELYIYRPGGTNTTTNGMLSMAYFSEQTGRTFMNETTEITGFLSDDLPGGLDISEISASGGETMSFHVNISNVQVTYPQGGEILFGGIPINITWKARSQIGYAKLEYSLNNGQSWQIIVNSAPNTGTYTWSNVPVIDTDECLIRVTTLTSNAVDECNAPFTLISTLGVPVPVFPTDQMVDAPTNPTFSWQSVPGAESYTIQVALDDEFVGVVINLIDLADTTYTYNNLMPFTTYYWRVAAFAAVGLSDTCPTQTFTTGDISIIPAAPNLIAPSQNAVNQPLNALLRWSAANYSQFYNVQISTNSFFTTITEEADSLQALQLRLQPLEANTRYYWRVRSGNSAGYSNFSSIRYFTTGTTMTANDDEVIVTVNELLQNSPNPFTGNTVIEFHRKDREAPVKLTVYNLKGQIVKVLFDGVTKSDVNLLNWNGTDASGKTVSNGIYYYRLESKGFAQTRKMLLLK
jgi:M6 family metalloprotease-like protein